MPEEAIIKAASLRDIVTARRLARQMCKELSFDELEQARVTAAISEVAGQISMYVTGGMIRLETVYDKGNDLHGIQVTVVDIAFNTDTFSHLFKVNDSFANCKQIMDVFSIDTSPDATITFSMIKWKR
jgi:serine/threonine-protein kinase RsbT